MPKAICLVILAGVKNTCKGEKDYHPALYLQVKNTCKGEKKGEEDYHPALYLQVKNTCKGEENTCKGEKRLPSCLILAGEKHLQGRIFTIRNFFSDRKIRATTY
ncbi:MAG: hypothetical protein K1X92_11460 [Bacteroidia bacterium]|nr:hypothetical protein [Bacteroidia bacterium]